MFHVKHFVFLILFIIQTVYLSLLFVSTRFIPFTADSIFVMPPTMSLPISVTQISSRFIPLTAYSPFYMPLTMGLLIFVAQTSTRFMPPIAYMPSPEVLKGQGSRR